MADDTTEPNVEQDQDDDIDWNELRADVGEGEQEAEGLNATPEDFGPAEPVPVEVTDGVYNGFREAFGEDQAEALERAWGNGALENEQVARAVVEDHPTLDQLYVQHQSDDGSVSLEGVAAAAEYLAKKAGVKDLDELSAAHPELDAIYLDHYNEQTGAMSPAGLYQALAYVGRMSGYKFQYRSRRR